MRNRKEWERSERHFVNVRVCIKEHIEGEMTAFVDRQAEHAPGNELHRLHHRMLIGLRWLNRLVCQAGLRSGSERQKHYEKQQQCGTAEDGIPVALSSRRARIRK